MRLPSPIEDSRGRSSRLPVLVAVALIGAVGTVAILTLTGDGDEQDTPVAGSDAADASVTDAVGEGSAAADDAAADETDSAEDSDDGSVASAPAEGYGMFEEPVRLLDTRSDQATDDGEFAGGGPAKPGTPLEIPVAERAGSSGAPVAVVLTVTALASDGAPADVVVHSCASVPPQNVTLRGEPGVVESRSLVVPMQSDGVLCLSSSAPADLVLDVDGLLDPAGVRALENPVRLTDTRAGGSTDDDLLQGIGVRPERSTLRVPVASRFQGELADVGAVIVSLSAADPLDDGEISVFPTEAEQPEAVLAFKSDTSARLTTTVPLGAGGELCVSSTGRTDLVIDIMAMVPASVSPLAAPAAPNEACPGQQLFPDRRIVAMYGTDRSPRLGVLGEQDPEAAVARAEEIAAPWRADGRPVTPAFELIATLATGTPEEDGLYRIRSSHDFVQRYLDVARRHGFYLILDLQAGRSDFLTEAQYYEPFLRQPDVGLALDPEWRTAPPARPRGGFVGQVDAAEVNAVIEWLAGIVAEEGLPEKLLVLHQFQERMVTNRDQVVELPGIALTIHMDGFGGRAEKQNTYSLIHAIEPWSNGLKLFYDEDIDIYQAAEVLDGAFDPIPDLITYQ